MSKFKICLVTVIDKRPILTNFVLSYYNKLKNKLKDFIEIELICIGSENELSKNIALKHSFEYHEFPNNPVSHKHNKVFEVCKNKNVDGVVYVGSDDIIDEVFFFEYIKSIENGIDFLGFKDVYFLTKDSLGFWGGYEKSTSRYDEPIGPGKFYSKKLLDKLNWSPWGNEAKDKGLDSLCWRELSKIPDIKKSIKSCKDINGHIIDIKTETNISNIFDFKFKEIYDINYILDLKFDYEKIRNILTNLNKYDLSIIISTYKNIEFIEKTFESIENSIKNQNVEVLVGLDSCIETLEFVKRNSFPSYFKFFYFPEHIGPYVIFNTLAKNCSSENLLFFSTDDVMCENMINNCIKSLNNNNLIKTNYVNFKNEKEIKIPKKYNEAKGVFGIKKNIFLKYNGFEPWLCSADSEFLNRMEKNKIKSTNTGNFDFFRRIHIKSLTNDPRTGLNSEIRKQYKKIEESKKYFGPLDKLETATNFLIKTKGFKKIKYFTNNTNNQKYDLSILISTYENVEYLKDCFNSIDKSIGDLNVEVLIGIDSCLKTREYVMKNQFPSNFRFYFFEKNIGPYTVFNTLSNLSSSENIMFFGSDDIMGEDMVKDMIDGLKFADCVRSSYINFTNPSEITKNKSKAFEGGVFAIRKEIFNNLNGFEPWMCEGDSEFILRLVKNRYKIKISNKIDFYRRIHSNGLTSRKDTGLNSKLRHDYRKIYINKQNYGALPKKVTEKFLVLKEGSYNTKEIVKTETKTKSVNPLNGLFSRPQVEETKTIDYGKVNDIQKNRNVQRPERIVEPAPENKNSNAGMAKNAAISKKPVKPTGSSPLTKIGKDFLRI